MSAATVPSPRPAEWQAEFVERVGALSDVTGLPPSHIRVFAWLLVCDPPEQPVDDLREALGLSAGAISMATATLVRMGFAERFTKPGGRRLYYRLHPGGWDRLLRLRLEATSRMRSIAEEALAQAPQPHARLAQMRDVYAWFEDSIARLLTTPLGRVPTGKGFVTSRPEPPGSPRAPDVRSARPGRAPRS